MQGAHTRSGRDSSRSEPPRTTTRPPSTPFSPHTGRFRPQVAEKLIHTVLAEALSDKQYSQDLCKTWSEQIGDTIRVKLKGETHQTPLKIASDVVLCVCRAQP